MASFTTPSVEGGVEMFATKTAVLAQPSHDATDALDVPEKACATVPDLERIRVQPRYGADKKPCSSTVKFGGSGCLQPHVPRPHRCRDTKTRA